MDKYEELANDIIDYVSDMIEDLYNIKPKKLEDSDMENPALLNGVVYYDMEDTIANKIRLVVGEEK